MTFLLPFAVAFLICVLLVPLTIKIANRFGFVDNPKIHKHPAVIHKTTLPRAGGLPIYIATVAGILLFVPVTQKIAGVILGGLFLILIGLLDDKYDIGSPLKLLGQVVASLIVIGGGVGINFIPNPLSAILGQGYEVFRLDAIRLSFDFFGPHSILLLADLAALFWIVWVVNMMNFSSGVDGQMPLIALTALLVIFAAAQRLTGTDPHQIAVSNLALIGAGATLGFLMFNFYPAKIFPGDSGSYFLGFLVAVCAILSGAKVGAAILVMAVPLTDGVLTIIRRIVSGKSPFKGDRQHLQHQLMKLGWGQRRIALFYFFACVILGALALSLHTVEKLFAGFVVIIIIVGGLLWLNMSLSQKLRS